MPATPSNNSHEAIQNSLNNSPNESAAWWTSLRRNSQTVLINLISTDVENEFGIQHGNKRFFTRKHSPEHGAPPPETTVAHSEPAGNPLPNAQYHVRSWEEEQRNASHAPNHGPADGPYEGTGREEFSAWRSGYGILAPIMSDTGEAEETISRLIGPTYGRSEFFTFQLSSAQKALLVPVIRLFKVRYETESYSQSGTGRLLYRLKQPLEIIGQREIIFDAYVQSADVDSMTRATHSARHGRLPGTGIKSFEWALKGVNPAEVDANIEATLQIFFNNIDDLFINSISGDTGPGTQSDDYASFMDLILFSPPVGPSQSYATKFPSCAREEYKGEFFEIMAEVGWATGQTEDFLFSTEQREYIESLTTKLFLQLTDHKFDFNDDGSAELTVNYRARTKLNDEQFDILALDDNVQTERQNLADAKGNNEEDNPLPAETAAENAAANSDLVKGAEEAYSKALKREYKEILKELITKHVYNILIPLDLLLNFRTKEGTGSPSPTGVPAQKGDYAVDLTQNDQQPLIRGVKTEAGVFLRYGGLTGHLINPNMSDNAGNKKVYDQVIAEINTKYNLTVNAIGNGAIEGPGPLGKVDKKYKTGADSQDRTGGAHRDIDVTLDEILDDESERTISQSGDADLVTKIIGPGQGGRQRTTDKVKINFFYLGDILEVFMRMNAVYQKVANRTLGFVTTDFQMFNLHKMYQRLSYHPGSREIGMGIPSAGIGFVEMADIRCLWDQLSSKEQLRFYSQTNLANIPINAELFIDFLKKKVFGPQRLNYYLDDFLNDIMSQFIKPVLADNIAFIGIPNNHPLNVQIDITTDKRRAPLFVEGERVGYDKPVNQTKWSTHTRYEPSSNPRNPPPSGPEPNPPTGRGTHERDEHELYDVLAPDQPVSAPHAHMKARQPGQHHLPGATPDPPAPPVWYGPAFDERNSIIARVEAYEQLARARGDHSAGQIFPPPPDAEHGGDVKLLSFNLAHKKYDGNSYNNSKLGILNFIAGLDRGILKSLSFDRVDQPFLREARVSQDKGLGQSQLRELYSVKLNLYGNNLVKPGQLIYVEPNIAMFGKPTSANSPARILGLGGYYLVIDVGNNLSRDGWETTVSGLHVSFPASDDEDGASVWDQRQQSFGAATTW